MKKIRMGVLISGSGRSLQNFSELISDGKLHAEIAVVISSKAGAYGIERCKKLNLPCFVIPRLKYRTTPEFSDAIAEILDKYAVELVVMAGFIHLFRISERYAGKVMNIHPALLPEFGGKGFYTDRVHEAVIKSGAVVSGCTVHFASNEYDRGPIILQRKVPILPGDTPHALADRVFAEECKAYPEAINMFAEGRMRLKDGKVVFTDKKQGRN